MTPFDIAARLAELGVAVRWVGGARGGPRLSGYPPEMEPAVRRLVEDMQPHRGEVLRLLGVGDDGEWCRGCGWLVFAGRGVTLEDVCNRCPAPYPARCPYRTPSG